MKCNLENREELISKYLMNELSDEESLKFEGHYFACKNCFDELKILEQSLNLVEKEGNAAFEVKEQKSKGNIFSFLPALSKSAKIGFAFASLILFFVLFSVLNNKSDKVTDDQKTISHEKQNTDKKIDSSKTELEKPVKKEGNLIAELSGPTFEPSPYYEEWINENVRSGNVLIDKIIQPKNVDKYLNKPVLFKWLMTENVPVNLVIMNNDDDVIFSTKVSADNFPEYSFSLSQNQFKKSGIYYWRIEDEIEVLYLGKFYFIK
jgi:hypothetical protein